MDAAGDRWCAVGDSAFSYEPLSGLGVQRALDSATRAAPAIKGFLDRNQPMNVSHPLGQRGVSKLCQRSAALLHFGSPLAGFSFLAMPAQFPIFANRAQPYRTHQPNSSPSDLRHHSE